MNRQRYEALDGWRGIAALLVALLHAPMASNVHSLTIVKAGHLWVDFFFVLSGFVLTHAYRDRIHSTSDVMRFVWRRFTRLWPLHVAVLMGFVALELAGGIVSNLFHVRQSTQPFDPAGTNSVSALVAHLALLHGVVLGKLTWNHPSWSISVEFWTAIIAVGVLYLARRRAGVMFGLLGAFAMLVLAFAAIRDADQLWMNRTYDFGIFRCIVGFSAGYLAYGIHAERSWHFTGTAAQIVSSLALLLFLSFALATPIELVAPLFFAGVILCFADGTGAVARALEARPFQALGRWSYAIYIVHALVVALVHRSLTVVEKLSGHTLKSSDVLHGERFITLNFGTPLLMDGFAVVYLGLVLVISALAWRLIDKPSQNLLNGLILLGKASATPHQAKPALPIAA